jgi:Tellurite resistance protein and related permeases
MRKIPVPFFGVGLAFAGLANLFYAETGGWHTSAAVICFAVSAAVETATAVRVIADREAAMKEIHASASAECTVFTFFMALMMLSSLAARWGCPAAVSEAVFVCAVVFDVLLIIKFAAARLKGLSLAEVTPAYLIPFIGIAVASVSAAPFDFPAAKPIAVGAFAAASFCVIPLLIAATIRYVKVPVPDPLRPFFTLYAAPFALILSAYIVICRRGWLPGPDLWRVEVLFVIGQCLYFIVIVKLPGLLKLPFMPSFTAFTFPLVLPAMASKQFITYGLSAGVIGGAAIPPLTLLVLFEYVAAAAAVVYVFILYLKAIFR